MREVLPLSAMLFPGAPLSLELRRMTWAALPFALPPNSDSEPQVMMLSRLRRSVSWSTICPPPLRTLASHPTSPTTVPCRCGGARGRSVVLAGEKSSLESWCASADSMAVVSTHERWGGRFPAVLILSTSEERCGASEVDSDRWSWLLLRMPMSIQNVSGTHRRRFAHDHTFQLARRHLYFKLFVTVLLH